MNRILLIAMLCFLVVPSASAAPATATVYVDCNTGQTINNALNHPAVKLTIEIRGICEEDVQVLRSNVALRGTDPAIDGIRPPLDDVLNQALNLFGVNTILIENLKITGGRIGIGINYSFGVTLINCLIEENDFAGVIAGTASGSILLQDTVITSTAVAPNTPRRGIWVTNGSNLTCNNCTIENHRTGILLTQGSQMAMNDSTVLGTRRGVDASGGSRFVSNSFFATEPSTYEGVSQAAIQLTDNASAEIGFDNISGKIRLEGKSVATLSASSQSNPSLFNSIDSGSSLVARDLANLDGDFVVTEFSNVTLPHGSTVSGSLFCSLGADAVCDNAADVTGSSDCGQCPKP